MLNLTDDRVQALNGDPVILKTWYRRPTGVDVWAFGDLDDLVEVELDTQARQITAVKHLSWKKLSNGQIQRARVLKHAAQMLDILRDSAEFRRYVNDAIKASQMLTADGLTSCRDSLIEMTERAEERRKTIEHLHAEIAKMKAKAQYKDEPDSEMTWLRSIVERALADRL